MFFADRTDAGRRRPEPTELPVWFLRLRSPRLAGPWTGPVPPTTWCAPATPNRSRRGPLDADDPPVYGDIDVAASTVEPAGNAWSIRPASAASSALDETGIGVTASW